MRRKQGLAALIAGTMIVLALLAVFAVQLTQNQAQSRRNLEATAHQRTGLVAGLLDVSLQEQAHVGLDARAALSAAHVAPSSLNDALGDKRYAALLDARGRIIARSNGFTAQARAELDPSGDLAMVAGGQGWAIGDIRPGGVVNVITRIDGPLGERVLVTGVPLTSLSQFTTTALTRLHGLQGQHQLLVDGNGVVVGSTVANRPAGYRFHTPAQRQTLTHGAGVVHGPTGVFYFDQVQLASTRWRLVLAVPTSQFFASVSGSRHYLPWVIFAAFGLVALAALFLIRRAIGDAERVRSVNAELSVSNDQLASAKLSLEAVNGQLATSNLALGRSNEELERQARELVRSNAELDQFASIASHDLQEPLRKVRTFTERISETEAERLSERGLDYLGRANASAERMQTLIEDLLRYSRVSTQDRPFTRVDLAQLTEEVLDDLSERIRSDGAVVHVGELPSVNADALQMRQLLQNLISNGLKFRREGVVPEVRIEAKADDAWVTLTVADNGIGFDPQYRQRIFRVFERLHGRGTYPGTGIGLALCRKIAERHGGSIAADSVPGEGATFTVTLQTQRTEAVSDAPSALSADSAPAIEQEPYVPA